MSVEYLNTPGVPEPQGFTHISIARGDRIIHVAGQVGQDENGEIVPGGLAAQAARPGPEVPVTLIGVQSLFQPDMLVEIEGVAIA
jgi:enamine deaminase RidA (YjgF/YER057c/UK114 family)